jgi:peptidyl-prolyl cis-trans isomerase D
MAQSAGKKTANIFIWILLGLLILGLAGFGATSFGGSNTAIATVGDRSVDVNRYYRAVQQGIRQLQQQTGERVSVAQPETQAFLEGVRIELVRTAAVANEADRMGLSVGDEQVARQLRDVQAFQGIDGAFSRQNYELALRQNGTTIAQFEDDIRSETARQLLQGAVAGGTTMPDAYSQVVLDFYGERRSAQAVRFGRALLAAEPTADPTPEQLQAYYNDNPELFTLPERKNLTYIWLTPEMVARTIDLSDEELRAEYDERIEEFRSPDRRITERLVFSDDDAALAAKARVESGEVTFAQLVEERGLTLDDVSLGEATMDTLDDAAEAVFALTEPGIVGPLPTSLGPALFQVNAILNARETSFEDAKGVLGSAIAADRARRQIDATILDLEDQLASGATLEEVSESTDMVLNRVEYFPGVPNEITGYAGFRQAANTISDGDFPELLGLSDGGIFALRSDGLLEPRLQDLDEVRRTAIESWVSAEDTKRLREMATTLAAQVAVGGNLEGAQMPIDNIEDLARTGFVDGAPPSVTEALFEMEVDEVRLVEGFGSVFVLRLTGITVPDPETDEIAALKVLLESQAAQSLSADIYQYYAEALTAQTGITFNNAAINAVHAEMH